MSESFRADKEAAEKAKTARPPFKPLREVPEDEAGGSGLEGMRKNAATLQSITEEEREKQAATFAQNRNKYVRGASPQPAQGAGEASEETSKPKVFPEASLGDFEGKIR